jgi:hypothetical protein
MYIQEVNIGPFFSFFLLRKHFIPKKIQKKISENGWVCGMGGWGMIGRWWWCGRRRSWRWRRDTAFIQRFELKLGTVIKWKRKRLFVLGADHATEAWRTDEGVAAVNKPKCGSPTEPHLMVYHMPTKKWVAGSSIPAVPHTGISSLLARRFRPSPFFIRGLRKIK